MEVPRVVNNAVARCGVARGAGPRGGAASASSAGRGVQDGSTSSSDGAGAGGRPAGAATPGHRAVTRAFDDGGRQGRRERRIGFRWI